MNNTTTSLTGWGAIALLALVLGTSGCQTTGTRSLAQRWGDSQVAHEVKRELSRDPFYKYPNVHPMVYEGTVQLSGFVETPEQRQNAAQLAAHARGVRQLVNCIMLSPAPAIREQAATTVPKSASAGTGAVFLPVALQPSPPPAARRPADVAVPAPAPARVPPRIAHHLPTQGAGAAALLER